MRSFKIYLKVLPGSWSELSLEFLGKSDFSAQDVLVLGFKFRLKFRLKLILELLLITSTLKSTCCVPGDVLRTISYCAFNPYKITKRQGLYVNSLLRMRKKVRHKEVKSFAQDHVLVSRY